MNRTTPAFKTAAYSLMQEIGTDMRTAADVDTLKRLGTTIEATGTRD